MPLFSKPTAVVIHDGVLWRAAVLSRSGGRWTVRSSHQVAGRSSARLPAELLEFAGANGARSLRVLLPTDLRTIRFQRLPDAEPEEMQTALGYEAAQELGGDGAVPRLAATGADVYDMGGEADELLAAALDEAVLQRFARDCADHALDFAGAGPLELAALAWMGAAGGKDTRLLLLRENAAFYAAPTLGDAAFTAAVLPLGIRPDLDTQRDAERLERAGRRLRTHDPLPVAALTSDRLTKTEEERLASLLGSEVPVEWHWLGDALPVLAALACHTETGSFEMPCPLVGPSPPPRDPHRAGTWLFFLILLGMSLHLVRSWHGMEQDMAELEERKTRWETLNAARQSAADRVDSLRRQQEAERAKLAALNETLVLPRGFLPLLDSLAEAMPPYTRLVALNSLPDGSFELSGRTAWQEGLTSLAQALSRAMQPHGLVVEPGGIALDEGGSRELAFSYRMKRAETGR